MRDGHDPSSDPNILQGSVQQGDTPGGVCLAIAPIAGDSQLDRRGEERLLHHHLQGLGTEAGVAVGGSDRNRNKDSGARTDARRDDAGDQHSGCEGGERQMRSFCHKIRFRSYGGWEVCVCVCVGGGGGGST